MNNAGQSQEPIRKSVVVLIVLLLLLAGGGLAYFLRQRSHEMARADDAASAATAPDTSTPKPDAAPISSAPTFVASAPVPAVAPVPPVPNSPQGVPVVSPEMRQIVTTLLQLNLTNGPLTPEKLAAWQQNLQQLTNAGTAVIPAIREFLQTKQDASFESIGGSAVMGQSSLRLAMLDALSTIGGPEATALSAQTLQSTLDPREIALLARNLEQQAPGEYRQASIDAARAALAEGLSGRLGNADVAALFSVLQQYGGADVVQDLQNAKGRWTYYSAIALGGLPDGAGVPALVQMAQDTSASGRNNRSGALQMLAQLAPTSPDARAALVEQTRTGDLPAATWIKISSLLGGEQLQLGGLPDSGLPDTQEPKKSSYHLSGGNQNFYTISVLDKLPPDQVNQRVQLIDQLLATNPGATAVDALQRARNALLARLQPATQ